MSDIRLSRGAHESPQEGLCTLEVVAMLGGEGHTDQPECCCPAVGSLCRRWNDDLSDEERTKLLLPLASQLVGSAHEDPAVGNGRAVVALDWLVRSCAPAWLQSVGGEGDFFSMALRKSPVVRDVSTAALCRPILMRARENFGAPDTREENLAATTAVGRSGAIAAWLDTPCLGPELIPFTRVAVPAIAICISSASRAKDPEATVQQLQGDMLELIERMLDVR